MPQQKNRAKKAGKEKPSAVVDALSMGEMSKDQLEEHIIRLREELDREREERSFFQLERDKIRALWEISRRNLEEKEAELRNSVREKDEAAERHRVEISVYKQKLKHVLSEQQDAVVDARTDGVSSSSLLQKRNAESELGLRGEVRELREDSREKELQEHSATKRLRLKQQEELMKLSYEYERRMQEMETRFHQRMRTLMETEEKKRRAAVRAVEERMRSRLESLQEENDRVLRKAEEYFSRLQENQREELNRWKEKLKKLQQQKLRLLKESSAAQQEKRRLQGALQEAQQKLPELHRRLQEHQHSKEQLEKYRAEKKQVDQELRELTVEHELLLQAFQKVQQERDELLRTQTESILDVQQRSVLKKLLLQKKLDALTEALEKKEAGLAAAAALSVCGAEPAARLEEILESKRSATDALQQDQDEPDRTRTEQTA